MSDRHCWLHHSPIGYHLESGQLPCGGVYRLCFTLWVGARGYMALYARAVVECGLCYQTCHMSGAQGADLADPTSVGGGNAAPPRWRGRVAFMYVVPDCLQGKSPEFPAAVASYVALTFGVAIPADTRCWTQGPVLETRPSY
jgi:hypothetical protein